MKPLRNLFMKKTHAGLRRADHLRQRSWLIFAIIGSGLSSLPKFLTRSEQLIDEVCFDADCPAKKMGKEHLGERWFLMDHAENSGFFQPHDVGFRDGRGRCYPLLLSGQTSFYEEFVRTKDCNDGFLALLRNDGDLHLAVLEVEDRIRGVSL